MARLHIDGPKRVRGEIVRYQSMGGTVVRAVVLCKAADGVNRYAVIPIPEDANDPRQINLRANPVYVDGINLWSDH